MAKSLILRADATDGAFRRNKFKKLARNILLPAYYLLFDLVIPIGSESEEHYNGRVYQKKRKSIFSSNVYFFETKSSNKGAAGMPLGESKGNKQFLIWGAKQEREY